MNLISCNNCAIVLDKDKLNFPENIYSEDSGVDPAKGAWDQDSRSYQPFVECPCCLEPIVSKQ